MNDKANETEAIPKCARVECQTLRAQLDVAKEALERYKGLCVHWNKNHHETCGRPADEALAKIKELEK